MIRDGLFINPPASRRENGRETVRCPLSAGWRDISPYYASFAHSSPSSFIYFFSPPSPRTITSVAVAPPAALRQLGPSTRGPRPKPMWMPTRGRKPTRARSSPRRRISCRLSCLVSCSNPYFSSRRCAFPRAEHGRDSRGGQHCPSTSLSCPRRGASEKYLPCRIKTEVAGTPQEPKQLSASTLPPSRSRQE